MAAGVWWVSVAPPRIEHMFEDCGRGGATGGAGSSARGLDAPVARGLDAPAGRGLDVAVVRAWIAELGAEGGTSMSDAGRVELIGALEDLANASRACQAVVTAELDTSQRAEQARAGVAVGQQGRGVAAQVALARRESPHRGGQHLGLARVLTREMPHTLAAFRQGRVSEWRTMLMARETACLELAERRAVDAEVAGAPAAFAALGDRQVVVACQRLAARLDQKAVVARRRRAESERRVSLRPAPEMMSQLSALLPVAQGVAVYAALVRSADTARAGGDARSRGQIMADTLVERVTGQSSAPGVPLRVNLVLSDRTLLGPIGGGGGGDGDGGEAGDGGDGDGDGGMAAPTAETAAIPPSWWPRSHSDRAAASGGPRSGAPEPGR